MRLTLRTLLAYLDDTLEPLEIKTIGQKVAESETAQELIARIKQATRRRRITTPPATGPNAFEPNMVAEYLDNELSPESVAELEKICLESDVHLAEVAACHQILTLVLGEPNTVPPTAKERMYALVQGREAIPFRKATAADGRSAKPTEADAEADEMFLLGLPFYRRSRWLRWALPFVAILLIAVVAAALWYSLLGIPQPVSMPQVAQAPTAKAETTENADKVRAAVAGADAPKDQNNPAVAPKTPDQAPVKQAANSPKEPKKGGTAVDNKPAENNPPAKKPEITTDLKPAVSAPDRKAPVNTERVEIGVYHTDTVGPPSLLVQRKSDQDEWSRVRPGARVTTNVPLMSLPGYASEVRLDNGIRLLLRGHVREFTPEMIVVDQTGQKKNDAIQMDHLQECALVLHKPQNADADLTLERGRLYVSNHDMKDGRPRMIHLRFEKKIWDLTLHPNAEVVVEFIKFRSNELHEAMLDLLLLRGSAGLALEHDIYPNLSLPGPAFFMWLRSKPDTYAAFNEGQQQVDNAARTIFSKRPIVNTSESNSMERALNVVRDLMTLDKTPLVALQQVLEKPGFEKPSEHHLAIYCLGAMDEIKELMNILGRADLHNAPDRFFAFVALRRWLDRGEEQNQKLYDLKTKKGLLIDFGYTHEEAERIMDLERDPTDQQVFSRSYYEDMAKDLLSDKVAIAELARWRLSNLAIGLFKLKMPKLRDFNAAWPRSDRRLAMQEVLEKINEGYLPPPDPRFAPGGKNGAKPGTGANK